MSLLFHMPRMFLVEGPFDHGAFERAVTALVARHEALRTSFHRRGTNVFTRVEPPMPVPVPLLHVPAKAGLERARAVEEHVRAVVLPAFDFERPPLVRAAVIRANDELHFLVLTTHHVVSDGWSSTVIQRDLVVLYTAFATNTEPLLPPLPIQYGDFAVWQLRVREALGDSDRAWWRAELEGAPREIPLPFDRPPTAEPTRHEQVRVYADDALARALAADPRRLFSLTWGAAAIALSVISDRRDLVLGTVHANRDRAEVMDIAGCFANFVALRARFEEDDESLGAFMERTLRFAAERFERGRYSFGDIVDVLGAPRVKGRNPLYNIHFQLYVDDAVASPTGGETRIQSMQVPLPPAPQRVDLSIHVHQSKDALLARLEYDSMRFDSETIARIGEIYVRVLRLLVEEPGMKLSELRGELTRRR